MCMLERRAFTSSELYIIGSNSSHPSGELLQTLKKYRLLRRGTQQCHYRGRRAGRLCRERSSLKALQEFSDIHHNLVNIPSTTPNNRSRTICKLAPGMRAHCEINQHQ